MRPPDSGLAPLLVGRAVSAGTVLSVLWVRRHTLDSRRPPRASSAVAGALDSLANLAFLLAARQGDLAVVAVITALYPAGTVLLARTLLAERLGPRQVLGLGVGAVAVGLLALP